MQILQITASAERRGAEVFAHQLAEALGRRGHVVRTVTLAAPTSATSLPFEPLPGGRAGPTAVRSLMSQMRRHDITVVHGGAGLAPTALAATLSRRPFVYRNIGDPSFWGGVRLADVRIGLPLRRAARVMALYEGSRSYMVRRYRLDPTRVVVSSNAVDAARFPRRTDQERDDARAALGVQDRRVVIGYLGALSAEKQPERAVALAGAVDDSVVLVAGDGPMRADIDALAARADRGSVQVLGRTDDPARFLRALDLLVIPSRTEGVPGVLLEAAFLGVPVVATDVGGVGDVARSIGGAELVGVDDVRGLRDAVLRTVASDTPDLADLADLTRLHDIEHVAGTWEQLLADAAGQPAAATSR